jgi:hypothetical protein
VDPKYCIVRDESGIDILKELQFLNISTNVWSCWHLAMKLTQQKVYTDTYVILEIINWHPGTRAPGHLTRASLSSVNLDTMYSSPYKQAGSVFVSPVLADITFQR